MEGQPPQGAEAGFKRDRNASRVAGARHPAKRSRGDGALDEKRRAQREVRRLLLSGGGSAAAKKIPQQ